MAADSLYGGDLSEEVDQESLLLLNRYLADMVGGSSDQETLSGGGNLVTGLGEGGEQQGGLIPGGFAIIGTIDNGTLKLDINLPKGIGFVFEGLDDCTAADVRAFLIRLVDFYLPEGQDDPLRESLLSAVDDLVRAIEALELPTLVVRVIDFLAEDDEPSTSLALDKLAIPTKEVFFEASSDTDELFAFNMRNLNPDEILVIKGVDNALISGDGAVRVEGDEGARLSSDNNNQLMIGGGGNDTLIGGGGHDTLTGGLGDDVFAFSRLGHFIITDFDATNDSFTFKLDGITNVQELLEIVTDSYQTADGVVFEFGAEGSITLVGVSASDLTADMIKFTL